MESQNQEQVEKIIDRVTSDLYDVESLLVVLSASCPSTGDDQATINLGAALKAVARLVGEISADLAVLL